MSCVKLDCALFCGVNVKKKVVFFFMLEIDPHWPCFYGEEIIGSLDPFNSDGCKWMCGARLLNIEKPSFVPLFLSCCCARVMDVQENHVYYPENSFFKCSLSLQVVKKLRIEQTIHDNLELLHCA